MPLPTTNLTLDAIHVEVGGTTGTTASLNDADIRAIGSPDSTYAPSGINTTSGTEISMGQFRNAQDVFEMTNSVKLENDNAEQLYYTPSSAGNRRTWTYSVWIKRTELNYNMMLFGSNDTYVYFVDDNDLLLRFGGTNTFRTYRKFRDTSAWYHFVIAVDTTQATSTNRVKLYVNGVDQAGTFEYDTFPSQNYDTSWNWTTVQYAAGWATASFNPSGYMAEIHNIDGQQLSASDFGEFDTSGIWKPKAYSGSYGTNGFCLKFEDASDMGKDTSGNNKNFVHTNVTSADQAIDTPQNNFCVMNPNAIFRYNPTNINSGGTKVADASQGGSYAGAMGSFAVDKGKWYYEATLSATTPFVGWCRYNYEAGVNNNAHETDGNIGFRPASNGVFIFDVSGGARTDTTLSGISHSSTTVYGIAIDLDNDTFTVYQSGSALSPTGINIDGIADVKPLVPYTALPATVDFNFGAYTPNGVSSAQSDGAGYGNFEYTPPTGYYALCTKNLAEYGG